MCNVGGGYTASRPHRRTGTAYCTHSLHVRFVQLLTPAPTAAVAQVKKEAADANGAGTSAGDAAAPAGAAGKAPRMKKEFDLPGQTQDTPEETDSLRKFYTSLLRQRPESEMAKKWCAMCHALVLWVRFMLCLPSRQPGRSFYSFYSFARMTRF